MNGPLSVLGKKKSGNFGHEATGSYKLKYILGKVTPFPFQLLPVVNIYSSDILESKWQRSDQRMRHFTKRENDEKVNPSLTLRDH